MERSGGLGTEYASGISRVDVNSMITLSKRPWTLTERYDGFGKEYASGIS